MELYSNLLIPDVENKGVVTTKPVVINNYTIEKLKTRYIAFDTETTGLNPSRDRIIELGAVLFENGKCVKRFQSLVNPGVFIPARVTAVNNITNSMIKNAPTEEIVYSELAEFLKDAYTVQFSKII